MVSLWAVFSDCSDSGTTVSGGGVVVISDDVKGFADDHVIILVFFLGAGGRSGADTQNTSFRCWWSLILHLRVKSVLLLGKA